MEARAGKSHPFDPLLKSDVISDAWCPGCGIGTTVNVFFQSIVRARVEPRDLYVVCGLGCSGRITASINLDGIKVGDEHPFEYAVRYKRDNAMRRVVIFLSDADFITYGVDDFIEATRPKPDILVIYINNLIYPIVYYEIAKLPPGGPSVYESREMPFNIPHLALSCGADRIARWTSIHTKRLTFNVSDALKQQGFSVVEVIAPCLMYCTKEHKIKESLDRGRYVGRAVLNHEERIENLDLRRKDIIIGRFKNIK
jgi:2-oxoglutarate ferredoxin oxidoreductase subunit beta